jgi:hypothetical protein
MAFKQDKRLVCIHSHRQKIRQHVVLTGHVRAYSQWHFPTVCQPFYPERDVLLKQNTTMVQWNSKVPKSSQNGQHDCR